MVLGRRVAKRKGQQLIALPPEVRARLGVIPGQWLYFHLGRKGEVVVSTSPARAGGKPPTADLEEQLSRALARIGLLEAKLAEAPETARREAWHDMAGQRLRLTLTDLPVLGVVNDRLRRIEDRLGIRGGAIVDRVPRRRALVRRVEAAPAPVLAAQASPVESASDTQA